MHVLLLLGRDLGVQMLGHMGTLCFIFWGTARLFCKATVTSSIAIRVQGVPIPPHPHRHLLLCVSFMTAIFVGVGLDLLEVLICSSLKANDVERFSCAYKQVCFLPHVSTIVCILSHLPFCPTSSETLGILISHPPVLWVLSPPSHSRWALQNLQSQLSDLDRDERNSNQALTGLTDKRRKQRQGRVACQSKSSSVMDEVKPQGLWTILSTSQATPLSQHLPFNCHKFPKSHEPKMHMQP